MTVTIPPGIVWLASYPKSGNTWMRVLLANLIADRKEPSDINDLSDNAPTIGSWSLGDDTLVDCDLLTLPELERVRAAQADFMAAAAAVPNFVKTHDRFIGVSGASALGTRARGAIYLLRDPRDVAISFAHHLGCSVDRSIAIMVNDAQNIGGGGAIPYRLGRWDNHVTEWAAQTTTPVRAVRYEDLRRDTAAVFRDILGFLGARATDEAVRRAVRHSGLDELQRQEAAHGFNERQSRQERFFRSGLVGEWREVLTPAQVRAIEEPFAPVMERWGYAPAG